MEEIKSGHPKMRTPIMLCLKARGIRITPPGNSYNIFNNLMHLNFMFLNEKGEEVS